MIEDVVGIGVDRVLNRAKAKRKAAIRGIAYDGEMDAARRRRERLEEDREAAITDPDSPHFRAAQQGERPTPRAQWDDAQGCWVEWDRAASAWVQVGVTNGDSGTD